jgi:nitrite reductase (NADH) large subunit
VRGGLLVGDASGYGELALMAAGALATPDTPAALVLPTGLAPAPTIGVDALADTAQICNCESVDKAALCAAVDAGIQTVDDLKELTRAGTGCGACVPLVTDLLRARLAAQGIEMSRALCEHFDHTRQELDELVRVHGYRSFTDVLTAHGNGDEGCEVCKPTVASILASRSPGYILDGEHAALQDTNDHALANLQRDGSYSVVPRVPGGEITPDQLIALGEIARDFGLYTKITGGQRIDLFGARLDDLPTIWSRVIEAGMESGHAYGKAVRTVKSCVGETWCRYGVQDSTSMAIALELRYRGLRAPHKIKMAVSGCARECAEAQSKDVGVIATERGWDLYVAGNGGKRPRHAELFATDLDDRRLVQLIDRFLMYYVRTADRLERTATWIEKLDGGLDHVRSVVIDDAWGIGAELEGEMERHVADYRCEWQATLESPERLARFVSYVNAPDAADGTLTRVIERGQPRPARPGETAVTLPLPRVGAR